MPAFLKKLVMLVSALALAGVMLPAQAQTFSSGSSGADGPFQPTVNTTLQLPPSGVFNFTTITIPSNVTVTFKRNAQNTPVTILATGDVVIQGTIDIHGGNGIYTLTGGNTGSGTLRSTPGPGGPGGFDGGGGGSGEGYLATANGVAGDGPGGGGGALGSTDGSVYGQGGGGGFATPGQDGTSTTSGNGKGGPAYGAPTLLQLVGGSGGGGSGDRFPGAYYGYAGGGGGGAIVIASSTTITGGEVVANGGGGGASGAGGAVRFVANTLAGSFSVYIYGGDLVGGNGYARFEAFNFINFSSTIYRDIGTVTTGLPSSVSLPDPPTLQIVSVGGVAAPSAPKGDFNAQPDITLTANATNPATVALKAANIPVGTVVSVQMSPEQGTKATVSSTALAGTAASSTATARVTLPNALLSVLTASATIAISSAQTGSVPGKSSSEKVAQTPPLMLEGEVVTKIEVASTFGGGSDVVYVTKSGKRFSRSQLLGRTPLRTVRR